MVFEIEYLWNDWVKKDRVNANSPSNLIRLSLFLILPLILPRVLVYRKQSPAGFCPQGKQVAVFDLYSMLHPIYRIHWIREPRVDLGKTWSQTRSSPQTPNGEDF